VPAEATRLQRRIGARDRWFLALLAVAALIGTASALVFGQRSADPSAEARCVAIIRASWMGGATFKYCGADAATFCRRAAGSDKEIASQCERAGLARSS
jgi:hypothetical protein